MSEITKSESPRPQAVPRYVWILLGSFALVVFFFGLTIPFLGPDEARYAQVAREMYERGDWVTPTLGGFNWFEKPALLYWLQIIFYKLFGVSEFSARLGPTLFGLGTVICLWLFGKSLSNNIHARSADIIETALSDQKSVVEPASSEFGNWLALIAATTLGIVVFSRGASFDIIVTFPMTAALVSFFVYDQRVEPKTRPAYFALISFYFFIGLSLLAKGLIGVVFPFSIVGFYYLLSRRFPNRLFVLSLFWGTLISVAVAATWYLPIYQRHRYEFINEFFVQHHFQRFTSNKYQHPQPFYFFLWVLQLMTFPWLPFFFAAIWKLVRGVSKNLSADTLGPNNSAAVSRFAIAWLVVPLVFFSLSGSKLPGYILPALPGAIILTASYVFGLIRASSRWRNIVLTISVSLFVTILLLLGFVVPKFADSDSVKSLIQASVDRGYPTKRVLMFHTLSHNAEFYAAGRLLRDEAGKQKKFYNVNELLPEIAVETDKSAIVLVPLEHLSLLTRDSRIKIEVIKDNTELAVVLVSLR